MCFIELCSKICFQMFCMLLIRDRVLAAHQLSSFLQKLHELFFDRVSSHTACSTLRPVISQVNFSVIRFWTFFCPFDLRDKISKFSFWLVLCNFHFCTCLPISHLLFYSRFTKSRTII